MLIISDNHRLFSLVVVVLRFVVFCCFYWFCYPLQLCTAAAFDGLICLCPMHDNSRMRTCILSSIHEESRFLTNDIYMCACVHVCLKGSLLGP